MRNKRIVTAALAAVMGLSACAGFAACGDKDGKTIRYVEPVPQTCTQPGHSGYYTDGVKYYSDKDGKNEITLGSVRIDPDGHTAGDFEYDDESGHWKVCSVCTLPATQKEAHDLDGDWIYDIVPTETQSGSRHKECECGFATVPETVPPTGGGTPAPGLTLVPAQAPTCNTAGNIAYYTDGTKCYSDAEGKHEIDIEDTVIPATDEHTAETVWQKGDGVHWHKCSVCGNKIESTEARHAFIWVTDVEPTETTQGVKHEECECGETRNENTQIPPLGVVVHHSRNEATCGADGNIEYWEKNGVYYSDEACTQVISGSVVIPATGEHTAETVWQKDGGKHWHNCSVCGNKIESTESAHTAETAWQKGDGKHWHNCSVCDGKIESTQADHDYTETVIAPTCTADGHTDHECECGDKYTDGIITALGHAFGKDKTEFDTTDNKFYRVCDNDCGTRGSEVGYFGNRYVIVNGTKYEVADCYKEENLDKGITYDPVKQEFIIRVTDNYSGALSITTRDEHVILSVDGDATISTLTFADEWGADHNLKIAGEGKLTVTDSVSIGTVLIIESDADLPRIAVGSNGENNKLIVGNAENTVQPNVNITTTSEGINSDGNRDLDYKILSGKLTITQNGSGNCGISLHRGGDKVEVGEHGTLEIKNFAAGIVGWGGVASVNVYGTLDISVTPGGDNGALQAVTVTVGSEEDGIAGKLIVKSKGWGIQNGSLNLVKGSAELSYYDPDNTTASEFAAFNSVSSIAIKSGFDLSIANFSVGAYGGAPEYTIDGDVVITVINMRSPENASDALGKYYDINQAA